MRKIYSEFALIIFVIKRFQFYNFTQIYYVIKIPILFRNISARDLSNIPPFLVMNPPIILFILLGFSFSMIV